MNDVLPKPFTKEGMLKSLQKHLPSFLKTANPQFPNSAQIPQAIGFSTPNNSSHPPLGLNMGQLSATQSLKDETSPGKSPATIASWHSPNTIPGPSPVGNAPAGYHMQPMRENPYTMTPTHPTQQQPNYPPPQNSPLGPGPARGGAPHRRVMSDMTAGGVPDEHDVKRQRMYPPPPAGYSQ